MLIPSKHEELAKSAEFILRNPQLYGISVDSNSTLSIGELFESILTFDEWFWINKYDLETVLEDSERFQFLDDRVKIFTFNEWVDNSKSILEINPHLPEKFFLPLPLLSSNNNLKLYGDVKVAVLIAGHRAGDFDQACIKQFTRAEIEANEVIIEDLGIGIFTVTNIKSHLGSFVAEEKISSILPEFYIDLMFHELLYIEDEGHQGNACRYLYNHLPQIEVETRLLEYLNSPDPDVRGNVYLGLSFPVYSAMVYLGKTMPSWESLTEPFTLSPDTVHQILRMIQQEKNLYVLDNAIGTLKAQNYTGKLLSLTKEVAEALAKVLPDIKNKQTLKDCERLLDSLLFIEFINWKEKFKRYLIKQNQPFYGKKDDKLPMSIYKNIEKNIDSLNIHNSKSSYKEVNATLDLKYA